MFCLYLQKINVHIGKDEQNTILYIHEDKHLFILISAYRAFLFILINKNGSKDYAINKSLDSHTHQQKQLVFGHLAIFIGQTKNNHDAKRGLGFEEFH